MLKEIDPFATILPTNVVTGNIHYAIQVCLGRFFNPALRRQAPILSSPTPLGAPHQQHLFLI